MATLISAVAALLSAVAWPVTIFAIMLLFRKELKDIAAKVPLLMDRVKRGKIGALELELQQAGDSVADSEVAGGAITEKQVQTAAKIESHADEIGEQELLRQLDRLCIEYDTIRRVQVPGASRTRAMTRVLVQMRVLGLSLGRHIEAYKTSGSAGSRLAAIAMIQMNPGLLDLEWLVRRFKEEAPFVFYHSALALQNAMNDATQDDRIRIRDAAERALKIVTSFEGEPDRETVFILKRLTAH